MMIEIKLGLCSIKISIQLPGFPKSVKVRKYSNKITDNCNEMITETEGYNVGSTFQGNIKQS